MSDPSAPPPPLDARSLNRLIEVGRSLLSRLDVDAVLDEVLETARELTGARYAALGILDESRLELANFITRGIGPEEHARIGDLPRGHGVLGLLITEPHPLRLDDVTMHPHSYGFPPTHPPMHTFLGVPVVVRGEAWGNLYLAEKEGGEPFTDEDEHSVIVLADWAAIAIENARLYERAEARRVELERAVRGFEATAAIAQAVGGDPELARVLELIVKRGRALVEARSVVILLEQDGALEVAAAAGRVEHGAAARLPAEGSTSGEVLHSRVARRVSDVGALQIGAEQLGVIGARTALLVPLIYRAEGVGVLIAFDRLTGEGEFSLEDQQVLEAFAASAAIAVATAKSVEADRLRRSLQAAEEERGRWARELHDETLQGLGALKVMLSAMGRQVQLDATKSAVAAAIEHVDAEIANLRGIIADLRPPVLDQVGLRPALRTLAERTSAMHGIVVEAVLALSDDARLPREVETTVYRLVQEALTNVVKHAGADTASVDVHAGDGSVVVRVTDDGSGFDPATQTTGFGLAGMRERVQLAGGTLQIAPVADGGTEIHARLPIPR